LREYQSEQVLNDQQFIMLKQDSRNKSIRSIIAKIGEVAVEDQVETLMASCEYVPPASAQATSTDKDKEIDHLDLVSKYIQEKSHKIAK